MLFTLVRHGDVVGRPQVLRGRSDPLLSEHGQQQMQNIIATIQPHITAVATSPLQRCHQFARNYSDQHQLQLHRIDELREIDFGDWEDLTLDEAQARDPYCFTQFKEDTLNWRPPNGEPYAVFRVRVRNALNQLMQLRAAHTLVFAHGGVIRAIIAECLQLTPSSAARIGIPLAGMCQLWLDEDGTGSLLRLQWLTTPCAAT